MKELITGLQHVGIPTNNLAKTVEFYHSLGFETALETVNEAAGEKVVFLRLGNLTVETYETMQAVGRRGAIDHIALDVTNIEDAFAQAKAAGYTLPESEIRFLPFWARGVRFFNLLGPNGETVELNQVL